MFLEKNKIKNKKGFYLAEAILAIFIVTVGLVAVVGLLAGSLRNTNNDRDQIIAGMLSQEGTEIMRNIRDNNFASSVSAFSYFPSTSNINCRIDYTYSAGSNVNCGSSTKQMYLLNNFYGHNSGGEATKFSRRISVNYYLPSGASSDASSTDSFAVVTSIVVWDGASFPNSLTNLSNDCKATSGCVYSQVDLTRWAQ